MSFEGRLDPDLVAPFTAMAALGFHARSLDDLIAQRETSTAMYERLLGPRTRDPDIESEDVIVPGPPRSPDVRVRLYRPKLMTGPLPCLYWIHGGGMVVGSIDGDDPLCERYVREVGCSVASVEYRLAPEHRYPAQVEDCYTGLAWLAAHAIDVGVDASRIAVGGSSAGGGIAAALALLARDRGGPPILNQMLIRPMLDDRNDTASSREFSGIPGWSREMNAIGWAALLGDAAGSIDLPPYAAPARATDLRRLPPTFIQAGELEVFRDEAVDYAMRLLAAGVATELHVYSGVFHGWDTAAPNAPVSRRSIADRTAALRRAFDRAGRAP